MDSNGLDSPLVALPPEIISMIISYLSLDDRKNARLTCQLLYDCCNSTLIREQEKFVFREDDDPNDVVRMLKNPESACLMHLEFQNTSMNYISPEVWKLCDSRVRSVEFYRCLLYEPTLRGVLSQCFNLTSMTINDEWISSSDRSMHKVIDELNANKITYPQLRNFVYVSDDLLDDETRSKIFSVFPNIQQFSSNFCFKGGKLKPCQVPSQLFSLTSNRRTWSHSYTTGLFGPSLSMPVDHLRLLTKYEERIPVDYTYLCL